MSEPEVVLVTGTRKGLGRYLAEHFIQQGALVEGCSRQPPDWHHENYHHHIVDVGVESQVKAMLGAIRKRHSRLDILVNNAGISSMNHVLLTPGKTVEKILATNFLGTFLVSRESAKLMKQAHYGRIVNIGTVAVPMKIEGESIYAASKSAVVSLSQILAKELAEFGITCNVVGPTPIDTDLIRGVPREKIDRIVSQQAVKRSGTFEDVVNVVEFFAKRESSFVTGQVLYLGGVG